MGKVSENLAPWYTREKIRFLKNWIQPPFAIGLDAVLKKYKL
jgi:hypothetical protein